MGLPNPESDQPVYGVKCSRCHCTDLRVTKTVRLPNGRIRRYRACRHCGRHTTTLEMPASEANRRPGTA
jgi:transcriptional regulator NrdR family protein